MAATIARRYCLLNSSIHGLKYLQLGSSSVSPQTQNPTVLKDVHRSAWYRSFFRSDQPGASNEETTDSADKLDIAPFKPKRPANSFLLYVQDIQDHIKQSSPGVKRLQILREASEKWKELDPETKSKFALERKEMMEKYKVDMMNYVENRTPEQIKVEKKEKEKQAIRKLKKTKKHLGAPARPLTAFACYMTEKLPERSNEPIQIYFKQVKDNWNNLSEHEKEVYFVRSKEYQEQYQSEMADWEERMIETGRFDVVRKKTLKKLKAAEKDKERGR